MGAGAQVCELALLIEGDVSVSGQVVDELHFEGFPFSSMNFSASARGSSNRSSFSFSLQIFRISASIFSRCSGVKAKGASMS